MNVRAILFDMDGTLIDSEPLHQRALQAVLAGEGITAPPGFDHASTGLSMPAAYALLSATTKLTLAYEPLVAAKYAAFLERAHELRLRDGAAAALAAVRTMGCTWAVVSNSDRMLVGASLAATGLLRPDMISVTRNDVREGKPAPEPYLRAAWLLGVAPADCIVVEDSPAGAAAGLAAGMMVVAWPEPHRGDLVFPDAARRCNSGDLASFLLKIKDDDVSR
jgi:HAD superfamily hydrolase (TIGR01509 family)